jgi:hypothetical protein
VNTTAKLDSSFAPVINVGASYQFDKHWGLSFSVSYIPLKTKAKLTTTSVYGLPVATSEASLKLNPIVTYLRPRTGSDRRPFDRPCRPALRARCGRALRTAGSPSPPARRRSRP